MALEAAGSNPVGHPKQGKGDKEKGEGGEVRRGGGIKERQDLRRRTLEFACSAVRCAELFSREEAGRIVRKQFLRSATSVGANYRAAQVARSKAEFVAKLQIALEEADESGYWLEPATETKLLDPQRVGEIRSEARELAAIFMSSLKTAKGMH